MATRLLLKGSDSVARISRDYLGAEAGAFVSPLVAFKAIRWGSCNGPKACVGFPIDSPASRKEGPPLLDYYSDESRWPPSTAITEPVM